MARRIHRGDRTVFYVDPDCHVPTIEVVRTRPGRGSRGRMLDEEADPLGVRCPARLPGSSGAVRDHRRPPPGSRRPVRWWWLRPTCWRSPCSRLRGSGGPTSPSGRRNDSECPWASAGPTPGSSPVGRRTSARFPVASLASPVIGTGGSPTGSPCRPGSSTSAGRRRRATSAPPRCCCRGRRPLRLLSRPGRAQGDRSG